MLLETVAPASGADPPCDEARDEPKARDPDGHQSKKLVAPVQDAGDPNGDDESMVG